MKSTATWKKALAFEGASDNGHTVPIDTTVAGGSLDSGMSPKQLVLAALCACSGMDVVGILDKMRVKYTQLEISAEAEQTTEHPRVFISIEMVYKTDVAPADLDKLKKAIDLSFTTYCGVLAMLKKHCPITYTIA